MRGRASLQTIIYVTARSLGRVRRETVGLELHLDYFLSWLGASFKFPFVDRVHRCLRQYRISAHDLGRLDLAIGANQDNQFHHSMNVGPDCQLRVGRGDLHNDLTVHHWLILG